MRAQIKRPVCDSRPRMCPRPDRTAITRDLFGRNLMQLEIERWKDQPYTPLQVQTALPRRDGRRQPAVIRVAVDVVVGVAEQHATPAR